MEQVRKRGLPPLLDEFEERGQAPLPDLFFYSSCLALVSGIASGIVNRAGEVRNREDRIGRPR